MPDAIVLDRLSKHFGKFVAVADLSLTVPSGSLFGFLGPNGAGKSSTINCLTGLAEPTSGHVGLLGKSFETDRIELTRRIGVMPETLGLFDGLYAHEFLAFNARMFGLAESDVRKRVNDLLTALELTDQAKRPLGNFSAGMRKRVAFAAAIVHRPEILFLDEPFESIDPAGVALMKDWLRRFVARGCTVFMTSHVLESVERLCDRVAIIKSPGQVVWQGDITALSDGEFVTSQGAGFSSLEALYLSVAGRKGGTGVDWL